MKNSSAEDVYTPVERVLELSGYGQTKWVSERLLENARDRGLEVTIIKTGFLGPSSIDGTWNKSDWLFALVRSCQGAQAVYNSEGYMHQRLVCVPVDAAAQAMVHLCDNDNHGKNFILNEVAPGGVHTVDELLSQAVSLATGQVDVVSLPFREWLRRVEQVFSELEYLRAQAMFAGPGSIGMVKFGNVNTSRVLAQTSILEVGDNYWSQALNPEKFQ
mmetsp:Transcript_16509/g.30893  ORF Transcript_16509/g.30893 Transcript_16509/m.30893 type:complete len:217 (-) Transcript_16509:161-811(-)